MNLFVPGRLCLFGEHSDWAGIYNRFNSKIEPGMAIVTGIKQGIYAHTERAELFRFRAMKDNGEHADWIEWPLSIKQIKMVAEEGGYYSYVAGVVAFMLEYYDVGGLSIEITKVTLPIKELKQARQLNCFL